jgi:GR25 family glycosyltransferase involved in LPS biosynthesis
MQFSELFKAVYIINLDNRHDRWAECVAELNRLGIAVSAINRFSAIPNTLHGIIGCGFSHASVLLRFLVQSDEPYCLILEDDFQFKAPLDDTIRSAEILFEKEKDWKVLMLCGNEMVTLTSTSTAYLNVLASQTASAYIVKRSFAPKLIEKLLFGTDMLKKYLPLVAPPNWGALLRLYSSDMVWKDLQKEGGWFVLNPVPVIQRPSYSDIMRQQVDYGV